jgi:hypothetical protein
MIGRALLLTQGLQRQQTPHTPTKTAEHDNAISTPKNEMRKVWSFSVSEPRLAVRMESRVKNIALPTTIKTPSAMAIPERTVTIIAGFLLSLKHILKN